MSLRELALHVLDITENSVQAGAKNITIRITEDERNDRLILEVCDDGKGMNNQTLQKVIDPFVTTRTTRRVGLGIPFLKAASEACNGNFHITSEVGKGTIVFAEFQRSHIDRMPLGDIQNTMINLIIGYPKVHWSFEYTWNNQSFNFDDQPLKAILEDVPLSSPEVISYLRETISQGINSARAGK